MAVKKLSFCLVDAMIMLRCDHLPQKRFLQKILNAKVNNCSIKVSDFNIELKIIKGKKHTCWYPTKIN